MRHVKKVFFISLRNHEGLSSFIKNGILRELRSSKIKNKNKFDKKRNELSKNKSWEVLNLSKSSYIVNKDVEAWLCLAKKN